MRDQSQQAYVQSAGTQSTNYPVIDKRDPSVNDIYYVIGRLWLNTVDETLWQLDSLSNQTGVTQANWIPFYSNSIRGVYVDLGTSPVTATNGYITATGSLVAAGTNPVRTDGTAVSTMTIEVQTTQSVAAADSTKNGLAHFDSGVFNVDADGFVSSLSGEAPIEKINLQAGISPIVSTLGEITFNGALVAAGSVPVQTRGTATDTMDLEVQISQVSAASDITKNGLCHFSDADFKVDANGFVTSNGRSTAWKTITASQTMVVGEGYMCISPGGALALALPATATIGDILEITLDGATSFSITQAAGQQIRVSSLQTTLGAGGSITSTAQGDTIKLVAQTATRWNAISFVGNLTVV